MTTIQRQQALLMKRTAWMNIQLADSPRLPSDEEKRITEKAIRMLSYLACLNYAMDDLEADLKQTGQFVGLVRRCFSVSRRIIIQAHNAAYKMLVSVNSSVGRQYNAAMDDTWQKIESSVLLSSPERGYNIVMALCRLVDRLNREIGHRYYFQPAAAIATIPSKLDGVKIHDYYIDAIIENNTK